MGVDVMNQTQPIKDLALVEKLSTYLKKHIQEITLCFVACYTSR